MAEDSFKSILFAFILTALFGTLLLTSVVEMGTEYSADTSQVVGGSLALTKFNTTLTDIETNAKDLEASFSEQSIWSAVAGVVVEGFFGIGIKLVDLITAPFDVVADIMSDVFHIPTIVTSVILGLLIISIMFGIWRLIKVGD